MIDKTDYLARCNARILYLEAVQGTLSCDLTIMLVTLKLHKFIHLFLLFPFGASSYASKLV